MEHIYYSPQNFQLIFKNLNQQHNNSLSIKECRNIIIKSMDFVWSNVDHQIPQGYTREKYLFLLNKKIISLCENKIPQQNTPKTQNEIPKQKPLLVEDKNINQKSYVFDGIQYKDTPNDVLEHPRAQTETKKQLNYEQDFNEFVSMRNNLLPKQEHIDFTDKNYKEESNKTINFDEKIESKLLERNHIGHQSQPQPNNPTNDIYSTNILDLEMHENKQDYPLEQEPIDLNPNAKFLNRNNLDRNDESTIIQQDFEPKNLYLPIIKEEEELNNNSETFSPYNSSLNNVILPSKKNLILDTKYINVSSLSRDFEIYPSPTNFQVKFSPTSNSVQIQNFYSNNNVLIHKEKVIYYGNFGSMINRTYDNIYSIKCSSGIFPQTPIITNSNFQKSYTINSEPYLLLFIKEFESDSCYEGTNKILSEAFAKLIHEKYNGFSNGGQFILFKTSEQDEFYKYNPTSLGKLDKMTLELKKYNQDNFQVGIDKLYVKKIEGFNYIDNSLYCNNDYLKTQITINKDADLYKYYCNGCDLNRTNIDENDLLYFFDTSPEECDVVYFEKNVRLYTIRKYNSKSIAISAIVEDENNLNDYQDYYYSQLGIDINITNEFVPFQQIFFKDNTNYYIYLSYSADDLSYTNNVFLKVIDIDDNEIIVEMFEDYDETKNYEIYKFGFTTNNLKGRQSQDKKSLFSVYGHRVIKVQENTNNLVFVVNFPFDNLPNYLLQENNYVFLIQDKLQVNYTFKIQRLVQDTSILDSHLN